MDPDTVKIVLALFGVINTALLVYQAIRLGEVHSAVNGAKDAAVTAAHQAGVVQGLLAKGDSDLRKP
jgi:hypothetical protein